MCFLKNDNIKSMQKPITTNQQQVLSFVKKFLLEFEVSPTLKEIQKELNIPSTNTVVKHLSALENKGYIVRRKNAKRNIEIRNTGLFGQRTELISVPILASVGCDDLSVVAEQKYDEYLEVDRNFIGDKKNVIAVRAIGNSMNDAGIENGDFILVEKTEICLSGDRVVAVVGDMVTVKKIEKREGLTVLWPQSKDPKYKPIILSENFKIAGKVICTIPGNSMDPTELVYDKIYN